MKPHQPHHRWCQGNIERVKERTFLEWRRRTERQSPFSDFKCLLFLFYFVSATKHPPPTPKKKKQANNFSEHNTLKVSTTGKYSLQIMSLKFLLACISSQLKTLGEPVTRFKLQKHESSFKHVLFTALYGCGIVQSSECAACFPKMLQNQQRFHWHATEWQTVFILLLWLQPSISVYSWLFSTQIMASLRKTYYVTQNIWCMLLFSLRPRWAGGSFSGQRVHFESEESKMCTCYVSF